MIYAYVLENIIRIYEVNNRPIFELIRDCALKDEQIFIDKMGEDRVALAELQSVVSKGDTVMIRSIVDLADTPSDIVTALMFFGERGVDVVSAKEPEYDYTKNYVLVVGIVDMCSELAEKKRRLGIERAKSEGRMGRKSNEEIKQRALKLKAADFPRDEILKICGISYSTYYRIIKN